MPAMLGTEYEVARPSPDRLRLVLDVPVDLTLQHHPPLVVQVIVGIVGLARRMTDDKGLDVVCHDKCLGPGRLALGPLDLVEPRLQPAHLEARNSNGHTPLQL